MVGRLFIAVDPTDEVRHALAAHLMSSLAGKPLPGRPVPPENWHLTLRFLGSTDEIAYDTLLGALDQADLGERFRLTYGGLGAFPRPPRATVLWVGVTTGEEQLGLLAATVEEACGAAGFVAEDRPFHAHLTLSRIRPHQDVRAVLERVPPLGLAQEIREVVVYRSHLGGPHPARYEAMERFELG